MPRAKDNTSMEIVMIAAAVSLIAVMFYNLFLSPRAPKVPMNKSAITLAVQRQGYTDITVSKCSDKPEYFGCPESDRFACLVSAKNVREERVTLTVCTGTAGDNTGVLIRSW